MELFMEFNLISYEVKLTQKIFLVKKDFKTIIKTRYKKQFETAINHSIL